MKISPLLLITLLSQLARPRIYYNLDSLKTVEGTVISIHKQNRPVKMYIVSMKNDTMEVILGPPFALSWMPNIGDTVVIFGSFYEEVVIAGNIYDRSLGKKLILRDKNGFPVWQRHGYKLKKGLRGRGNG